MSGPADPLRGDGSGVADLVAVMDVLRSPGGCPWDAEQTHASLVEYSVEETYELVEAIETGDRAGMREELGDLLLQVAFHCRIAAEHPDDPWTVDDVAAATAAKLRARHPHVFAGAEPLDGPEQVEASWHALKAAEKGRTSVTDGVPVALPALLLAAKLRSRAARGGVDVPVADAAAAARAAELVEGTADEAGLGDLLLALVSAARDRGWDAEAALRGAVRGYRGRLRAAEGAG